MAASISKADIIYKFSETIGIEKATSLLAEATLAIGLSNQEAYSQEEALKIFGVMKQKGGIIKIIAGFLASEVHLMNM